MSLLTERNQMLIGMKMEDTVELAQMVAEEVETEPVPEPTPEPEPAP